VGIGYWEMGVWGLGIGPNPQSPIPNPQSPIPNPHVLNILFQNFIFYYYIKYKDYKLIKLKMGIINCCTNINIEESFHETGKVNYKLTLFF